MASWYEWTSMKHAMGELYDDPRVAKHIDATSDLGETAWTVDFPAMTDGEDWFGFTQAEAQVLLLAQLLYSGAAIEFDFGALMSYADNATWQRCMEAIAIKRPLDDEIPSGRLLRSWPS